MTAYAILGLGARGEDFRGKTWRLPFGTLTWVRWHDRDWDSGEKRPATTGYLEPDDLVVPEPPFLSEAWLDLVPDAGRFVVFVDSPGPWATNDEAADAVAEAIAGLLALAIPFEAELVTTPLESAWIEKGVVVVQDLEQRYPDLFQLAIWANKPREASGFDPGVVAKTMSFLGAVLSDGDPPTHGTFAALVYFRLSAYDFAFGPSDRKYAIQNPTARPELPLQQGRAEAAFQNAWKAIEATLGGEPPRAKDKLRRRLAERNIDPDSDAGFPSAPRQPIIERLQRLHGVRDRQAAHGGRTGVKRREITFLDLVEIQWIAERVILSVLEPRV